MKIPCFRTRFLTALLLLLPFGLAFADSGGPILVDCSGATPGAFTSLETAILTSPDNSSFSVSGTCAENVSMQNRNNLSVFGNPKATLQAPPNFPALSIFSSREITFSGITFSGGSVSISGSQNIFLSNITQQNGSTFGVTSTDSVVHLTTSTISGNARTGIVISGGSFYLDGGVTVSTNGRLGISAGATHLTMSDGDGPNIISQNGLPGIQVFGTSQADFTGDNEITSNNTTNSTGAFGLLVQSNAGLTMNGGTISNNSGTGVICDLHSHCQLSGTHIDSNTGGGVQITEHSMGIFGASDISNNNGTGVLVDQSSSLTTSADTIANNTGDGLILNTLSTLKFLSADVITASAGNLALNCNNGSMVDGDISAYKPKKCGAQFQAVPIH